MTKLSDALGAGDFTVTAELGPPRQPDAAPVRETARRFAPIVHAANVTDNQAATVKLSPVACSVWMIEEGLDPILQVTTRDRNLLAIQADLLGAWALGVRAVLALSGDPLKVGPYAELSKPVADVDSMGLLELIAAMNAGRLAAGEDAQRADRLPDPDGGQPARRHRRAPRAEGRTPARTASRRTSSTTSTASPSGLRR